MLLVMNVLLVTDVTMQYNAEQGCREHLGCHPCDQRRPLSYLQRQFPGVDFSLVCSLPLASHIPAMPRHPALLSHTLPAGRSWPQRSPGRSSVPSWPGILGTQSVLGCPDACPTHTHS